MQVTLVRHGQAQTGALDEASYDNLSDLGRQQAGWLGQYLSNTHHGVKRIYCGSMNRQRDTALAVASQLGVDPVEDERLNEINYFALADSLRDQHGVPHPTGREEFLEHLPQVMKAWHDGLISCPNEAFADYEARVADILSESENMQGTMLVTSGGIIGMAIRLVLGLENEAFAHVLLQINNSSLHRYAVEAGARRLMTFNATPHLDAKGRETARTYI